MARLNPVSHFPAQLSRQRTTSARVIADTLLGASRADHN